MSQGGGEPPNTTVPLKPAKNELCEKRGLPCEIHLQAENVYEPMRQRFGPVYEQCQSCGFLEMSQSSERHSLCKLYIVFIERRKRDPLDETWLQEDIRHHRKG